MDGVEIVGKHLASLLAPVLARCADDMGRVLILLLKPYDHRHG